VETYDGYHVNTPAPPHIADLSATKFGWNDITKLLAAKTPTPVTWAYYHGDGWNPSCGLDSQGVEKCKNATTNASSTGCFNNSDSFPDYWNPIKSFVGANTANIKSLRSEERRVGK